MSTPMLLNTPEAISGRELVVSQVEGIAWQVVAICPKSEMSSSRVRLRTSRMARCTKSCGANCGPGCSPASS